MGLGLADAGLQIQETVWYNQGTVNSLMWLETVEYRPWAAWDIEPERKYKARF